MGIGAMGLKNGISLNSPEKQNIYIFYVDMKRFTVRKLTDVIMEVEQFNIHSWLARDPEKKQW